MKSFKFIKSKKQALIVVAIFAIIIIGIVYLKFNMDTHSTVFIPSTNGDVVQADDNASVNNSSNNPLDKSQTLEIEKKLIKVHIIGEVKNPGVYELEEGLRIIDAINSAGGLTEYADESKINMAAYLSDAQQIDVYSINDDSPSNSNNTDSVTTDSSNGITDGKVNINKATKSELITLSGIGDSIANGIIAYREENGDFTSIEQVKNVSRIGEKVFAGIKENITVD